MMQKLKKLMQGKFVKNITVLASGTAGAQLITIAASPVITRLYGPEAFGILGVFLAMINIVTPAAALTYPIAVVLPKEQEKAKDLIRLSLAVSLILAVAALAVVLTSREALVSLFNMGDKEPYLLFIPLLIIFGAMVQTSEQWLIRMKEFTVSAKVKLYHAGALYGSMILIGLFYPAAAVLVTLAALGNLMKSLMMAYYSLGKTLRVKKEELRLDKVRLRAVAKEHDDFPKYRAPQVLLNAVSQGMPLMMLSALFGPAAAGFYSIGKTVLGLPAHLIGKAVGDVFYPNLSEADKEGRKLTPLVKKGTLGLAAVGVVPFGIVVLIGPFLFEFVFGAGWDRAGEYARWMAFMSWFMLAARPVIAAVPVVKAQRFFLIYEAVSVAVRFGALLLGFYFFDSDLAAVALFSLTSAATYLFLMAYVWMIAGKRDRRMSKEMGGRAE
ncbi:lipopolysaccharide biosynthesis protein [Alkalicoccus saliphilus]|uniref:Polysaccharide biosynthesis protein n=1 Tax=Alkalicoccus saliphilus TaxID=200989 RepID=A0A2T4U1Q8_9BACI|nr:lipopolysaccharide biosynthesis protein [Alkalicoccus saliphilus]PTL37314.1 polysaccharide biosynthesis protein [Alkalicoccus saliphilus]